MPTKLTEAFVRKHIGDPAEIAKRAARLQEAAKALSSSTPRLIDRYAKRWVAVDSGEVVASAATFSALQAAVLKKDLPRDRIVVRYIDRQRRTMIL